jgi:hypothetical protein
VTLVRLAHHRVHGTVRDDRGSPVRGATVTLADTPIPPTTTAADGTYAFAAVPVGTYELRVDAPGGCDTPAALTVAVTGPRVVGVTLQPALDAYGYACRQQTPGYVEATTVLPFGDDTPAVEVTLPFAVTLYGRTTRTATVERSGWVRLAGASATPFSDLALDGAASVRTRTLGSAPDRRFVVEWRNAQPCADEYYGCWEWRGRVDAEVIFHERGDIEFQYRGIDDDPAERAALASIGITTETGATTLWFASFGWNPVLPVGTFGLRFSLPPNGFVQGVVTDANDGAPVVGATVRALRAGVELRSTVTDDTGAYRLQVPLGAVTVEATADRYVTKRASASIATEGQVVTRNLVLATARAALSPGVLSFTAPRDRTPTAILRIANTGSAPLTWTMSDAADWLSVRPASGTLAPGASRTVTVSAATAGLSSGSHVATLVFDSNSGRQPSLTVPVDLVVAQVVLVSGNAGAPPAPDRALVAHLEASRWPVTVVDDDRLTSVATRAALAAADVVVVSSSVNPGLAAFTTVVAPLATPVVLLEPFVAAPLGLAFSSQSGELTGQRQLRIWNGHPLAAGLEPGVYPVTTTATTFGWYRPVPSATVVATQPGTARAGIFGIETGRALVRGVAPERRVGFFFSYPTPSLASATGWQLFDAAVRWASGIPREFYRTDFTTGAGPEWSTPITEPSPSGEAFLGRFGNDTVALTVPVPVGVDVRVAFDLYVIRTWDGNDGSDGDPDVWEYAIGGTPVLRTTFSNVTEPDAPEYWQSYPDAYPATHPARTGAVRVDDLGWGSGLDGSATYRIERTVRTTGPTLTITLTGSGLQDLDDESWGVDNVVIAAA